MKKGIALLFPALCGCSQRSCVSCQKSCFLPMSWHSLWLSCGAGGTTEGCIALSFPSHQITEVSYPREVSDRMCQEEGAQPMPLDHSGNTVPGREQREGGRWKGSKQENNLQVQSAAACWVPGKNLTWPPPVRGLRHWQVKGKSSHC